jgi:hypothetical protein
MRTEHSLILALILLFLILTCRPVLRPEEDPGQFGGGRVDVLAVDITQRTCALEVVLSLQELDAPHMLYPSPGRIRMPWDAWPGNTMLACLPAPTK